MLTGPDWVPREFTEQELDEIESRKPFLLTMEELGGLIERSLKRMTPEEKARIRKSTRKILAKERRERDARLIAMPPATEKIQ